MASGNLSPRKRPSAFIRQLALAMELPLVMVGSVAIGGGAGYLLDRYFHTEPVIMLVGGLLGFVGGTWDIIRRLCWEERRGDKGNGENDGR
jgi:F0F1-type ATP synthase assembly protein I